MDLIFLGVDVGGTKTEMVTTDEEGKIIARVLGGTASHESVGLEGALKELRKLVEEILRRSGIGREDLTFSFFGMAGLDHEEDYRVMRKALEGLGIGEFDLENDGVIGLRSGSVEGTGIVINCGTGSVSFAHDGKSWNRIGGYSWAFGERLGSYHIAGLVLSSVVRSKDLRDGPTLLVELVESALGMEVEELRKISRLGLRKISEYVPRVIEKLFEAYELRDFTATRIISEVVSEIVKITKAHSSKLDFSPPIKLVLIGSFFKNAPRFLIEMIGSAVGKDFELIVPEHNPVVGAVLMAMERHGISVDERLFENLVSSYLKEVK